jgi:PAS domain S-box-containing protein
MIAPTERQSPLRVFVATLVPLLVVFVLEAFFWGASGRWSPLYPAVLACAWLGGFESGVAATVVSVAVMWWFFVPPEHHLVKPDGSKYFMALTFVIAGSAISVVMRVLRRNAAELSRNQRLLQAILDHSPEAIVIKDLEGRYVLVNKAFEALSGVTAEAALHRTAKDIFPHVIAEDLAAKEKVVRETRAPMHYEEANAVEGRVLLLSKFPLIDESNVVFGIGTIQTDITERKRDEEALRETTGDLRIAQHVAHVGSWRWDFRTNQAKWSDELYQIFGIDPSQPPSPLVYLGARLMAADSLARLRSAIERLRLDGEPYDLELEFTRLDGAVRWCATRGEPVRDAQGQIIGINGTVDDITHIKELERLREEWTSLVAHDLRQPLSVLTMASDFLPTLHEGASQEERTTLQSIQSATQAIERMVDDLLDMSLLEAHRLKLDQEWIDLRVMVRETVKQMSHLSGTRIDVHESGQPVSCLVDPMRIGQVLGNLISNAVKYGDRKTAVDVSVDRTDGEVRIGVTNHGPGITSEEMPRLFERFMRSKTARGSGVTGLGLGLYIARGIVEAHGGRIWADSAPGKATTFYIALPAAVVKAQEAA